MGGAGELGGCRAADDGDTDGRLEIGPRCLSASLRESAGAKGTGNGTGNGAGTRGLMRPLRRY